MSKTQFVGREFLKLIGFSPEEVRYKVDANSLVKEIIHIAEESIEANG